MAEPMFSVIVPAHNSEAFIRKGIESIVNQQDVSFELIVVCDSCTDNTQNIAEMYGAKTVAVDYGRDGLSRDKGISMATGEWILFMDDDDWFVHEYCFRMLKDKINSYKTWTYDAEDIDAIVFGYLCKGRGYVPPSEKTIFQPGEAHVWSNCWRRKAISGAAFGDAMFCSDTYFVRDMKKRVKRYELFDTPLYYYNFLREGSQTDLLIQGKIRQSPVAR